MRRIAVLVCAWATTALAVPASAASMTVDMKNIDYNPRTVNINPGDTVTWRNQDSVTHTVTDDNGAFDSGNVSGTVGTYSHTFSQPGTFTYHCNIHSNMHGTVIVQGGGPAPTQPPAPAPAPATATTTPAPRATTTSRPTTTSSASSTTTTLAPPAAVDAGTTTSTTAAAGGGVALPAKKTSSGGDSVSPWLAALAVVLVLGAASGGELLRRRLA